MTSNTTKIAKSWNWAKNLIAKKLQAEYPCLIQKSGKSYTFDEDFEYLTKITFQKMRNDGKYISENYLVKGVRWATLNWLNSNKTKGDVMLLKNALVYVDGYIDGCLDTYTDTTGEFLETRNAIRSRLFNPPNETIEAKETQAICKAAVGKYVEKMINDIRVSGIVKLIATKKYLWHMTNSDICSTECIDPAKLRQVSQQIVWWFKNNLSEADIETIVTEVFAGKRN